MKTIDKFVEHFTLGDIGRVYCRDCTNRYDGFLSEGLLIFPTFHDIGRPIGTSNTYFLSREQYDSHTHFKISEKGKAILEFHWL